MAKQDAKQTAAAAVNTTAAADKFEFSDEEVREMVAKRVAKKAAEKAARKTPEGKAKQQSQLARTKAKREALKAHAEKLGLKY